MRSSNQSGERSTRAIAISGFGIASLSVTIVHGLRTEPVQSALIGVGPPLVISIGFVALGAYLYYRKYDQKWVKLLQRWHLVGAVTGGVISLAIIGYQASHGIALIHPEYLLYNTVVGGAGVGAVFGYHDLKVQQRAAASATSSDILNTLREINRDIATIDDRDALERQVCETVADADSYALAWIGGVDDGEIVPRTSAGGEDGYLDEITITIEEGETANGPAGRAVRTREPQVMDTVSEPDFEPWREAARERGYHSSMAIPLTHDGTLYGLLCIYANHPAAFNGQEFDVLAELGDTIADAINAIELRESQTALLDSMNDAALVYSLERDSLVAVNQAATERLGYSREELTSMSPDDFDASDSGCRDSGHLQEIRDEGGAVFETVHETKAGERVPVEISAAHIQYRGEPAVLAVARDIRERKEREQRLRSYREALDHAGHAIYITDVDGTIEYVNPAFESQTGYGRGEAIGETPNVLRSGHHDDEFYENLWTTILDGDVWHNEKMIDQRKDGTEYHVDQTIAPIIGEDGEIERFVAVAQDITALKQHEATLEEQQAQLELFNRLLRHDIRNDMQVVLGRSRLLAEQISDEHEQSLQSIIDHGEHVVELTRRVRKLMDAVLTKADAGREPVALDSHLEAQLSDFRSEADSAEISVDGEIPSIRVCATDMLGSVFRNLVSNAIQHNDQPVPRVTVRVQEAEETVTVEFEDNGPGIPAEHRDTIFGKGNKGEESQGTGLGLYLVDVLVEQYGGDVRIVDTSPDGTTIAVELQKAKSTASQ